MVAQKLTGTKLALEMETALRDAARRLDDDGWTVEEVDVPPLREAALAGRVRSRIRNPAGALEDIASSLP